jgi:hypothetical protein
MVRNGLALMRIDDSFIPFEFAIFDYIRGITMQVVVVPLSVIFRTATSAIVVMVGGGDLSACPSCQRGWKI